jgi:hypothetical protein
MREPENLKLLVTYLLAKVAKGGTDNPKILYISSLFSLLSVL